MKSLMSGFVQMAYALSSYMKVEKNQTMGTIPSNERIDVRSALTAVPNFLGQNKDTKTGQVSVENQKQRKEVRERLSTEDGERKYRKRKIEVEPVFGQIKHNQEFKRFALRGLSKNTTDWGLICVAHNLMKWQATSKKQLKKA